MCLFVEPYIMNLPYLLGVVFSKQRGLNSIYIIKLERKNGELCTWFDELEFVFCFLTL